ncbi:hypothetical protein ARMGADRAFT_1031297 [Armillaria gallica]|uniref:Uncharacterized protein n=1 Tax=Armillaria gallica TaxID=47427 RepID=A0A2H3D9B3_ARMGA|nr:hypothetical protein ARMGADRAFT_1031297 [Armillaria gallica]
MQGFNKLSYPRRAVVNDSPALVLISVVFPLDLVGAVFAPRRGIMSGVLVVGMLDAWMIMPAALVWYLLVFHEQILLSWLSLHYYEAIGGVSIVSLFLLLEFNGEKHKCYRIGKTFGGIEVVLIAILGGDGIDKMVYIDLQCVLKKFVIISSTLPVSYQSDIGPDNCFFSGKEQLAMTMIISPTYAVTSTEYSIIQL